MADFPAPAEGIVLTHFLVSDDVDRSRAFYTEVLGGEALMDGEPTIVALANSWIIINTGGGPTDDKPSITLEDAPGLAARRFPGVAVHLAACGPCDEDFQGLLAAAGATP